MALVTGHMVHKVHLPIVIHPQPADNEVVNCRQHRAPRVMSSAIVKHEMGKTWSRQNQHCPLFDVCSVKVALTHPSPTGNIHNSADNYTLHAQAKTAHTNTDVRPDAYHVIKISITELAQSER